MLQGKKTYQSPIVGQSLLFDRQVCFLVQQLFDIFHRCEGRDLVGPQANVLMTNCHPWQPWVWTAGHLVAAVCPGTYTHIGLSSAQDYSTLSTIESAQRAPVSGPLKKLMHITTGWVHEETSRLAQHLSPVLSTASTFLQMTASIARHPTRTAPRW